ncbi:MAG: hypothetical protein FWG67_08535 [Defluviitaleaceae bacterium]|nr:hypothetical protein [Defluviitaleaceae bacterium]
MAKYNISTFIPIIQSGLVEHNKQEAAGRLLLDAIAIDVEVDIPAETISNLVNQKIDVHHKIKKASARPEVMEAAIEYFESEVLTDLNPNLTDDICTEILRSLAQDPSVSPKKREELTSLYHEGALSQFLTKSYLYAINRPNKINKPRKTKKNDALTSVDEFPLIYEVNNKCPLCADPLVKKVKEKTIEKYKIVHIFPLDLTPEKTHAFQEVKQPIEDLTASENKIALCIDCAESYQIDTTLEEYASLLKIKDTYTKSYRLQQTLNGMALEDEIKEVIHALAKITYVNQLPPFLSLEALEIKKKIHPKHVMLIDDLTGDVLKYYRFIEHTFSQIGNFNLIASEIQATFYQIEKDFSDQIEIKNHLTEWMLTKTKMPHQNRRACEIIVAFFVQNCEVFYEIPR